MIGNAGLGYQTALALAAHNPGKIYLCARNATKAKTAIESIKAAVPSAPIEFLELDVASLSSVVAAAKKFTSESQRLDTLYLNAGIMAVPEGLTTDGYEIQFGTNHVGHALLVKLLLPTLLCTTETNPDVRIVSLSSYAHNRAPKGGIEFESLKSTQANLGTWDRYGESKLANILYAKELARRYPAIKTVSVHPGFVMTNLSDTFAKGSAVVKFATKWMAPLVSVKPAEGALNQLWAGTAKDVVSGEYYTPVGVTGNTSILGLDSELAKKLWDWTEKELEGYGL